MSVTSSGRSSISSMMRCISGMVLRHGLGDVLQQDGLAGARRRDDQAALSLADRREQVHDARGQRLRAGFQRICSCGSMGVRSSNLRGRYCSGGWPSIGLDARQARPACPLRAASTGRPGAALRAGRVSG